MTGANGTIDFNPSTIRGVYDSDGNPTGFTGFGDDSPLRATAVFGQNRYIAFLTNDLTEGAANTDDTNGRAVITAAAAGPHNTFEIVQAIVQQVSFPEPPAVITMLGPTPDFDGGTSTSKLFSGNDCTDPNVHVPVIAVVGSDAVTSAAEGVHKPLSYVSGTNTGTSTIADVTTTIDPAWTNCPSLHDLANRVRAAADVVGTASTPQSALGIPGAPRIVSSRGTTP
jgi:hypothetical protein